MSNVGSEEQISSAINFYLSTIPTNQLNYLTIANAYLALKQYDKALAAISQYNVYNKDDEIRKYAIITEIYEKKIDWENAYKSYIDFNSLYVEEVYRVFEQDTQFMEEKHALETKALKESQMKQEILFAAFVLIMLAVVVIFVIKNKLKRQTIQKMMAEQELEKFKQLYSQMESERDDLAALLEENKSVDPKMKEVLSKRLDMLNKWLASYIADDKSAFAKLNNDVENLLKDKESFIASTITAYRASNPDFIAHLEKHNLTEREIGYCCLYALGLNGKEIGRFLNTSNHYNTSSAVRDKLGLAGHDTNLGIHIRKLLS